MLQYRNPTLPSPLRSYFSEQYHPPSRHEAKVSSANVSARKPTGAKVTPVDASRTRAPKASQDLAQINSELELAEKRNKVPAMEGLLRAAYYCTTESRASLGHLGSCIKI